jgi:hypothetical protein
LSPSKYLPQGHKVTTLYTFGGAGGGGVARGAFQQNHNRKINTDDEELIPMG